MKRRDKGEDQISSEAVSRLNFDPGGQGWSETELRESADSRGVLRPAAATHTWFEIDSEQVLRAMSQSCQWPESSSENIVVTYSDFRSLVATVAVV